VQRCVNDNRQCGRDTNPAFARGADVSPFYSCEPTHRAFKAAIANNNAAMKRCRDKVREANQRNGQIPVLPPRQGSPTNGGTAPASGFANLGTPGGNRTGGGGSGPTNHEGCFNEGQGCGPAAGSPGAAGSGYCSDEGGAKCGGGSSVQPPAAPEGTKMCFNDSGGPGYGSHPCPTPTTQPKTQPGAVDPRCADAKVLDGPLNCSGTGTGASGSALPPRDPVREQQIKQQQRIEETRRVIDAIKGSQELRKALAERTEERDRRKDELETQKAAVDQRYATDAKALGDRQRELVTQLTDNLGRSTAAAANPTTAVSPSEFDFSSVGPTIVQAGDLLANVMERVRSGAESAQSRYERFMNTSVPVGGGQAISFEGVTGVMKDLTRATFEEIGDVAEGIETFLKAAGRATLAKVEEGVILVRESAWLGRLQRLGSVLKPVGKVAGNPVMPYAEALLDEDNAKKIYNAAVVGRRQRTFGSGHAIEAERLNELEEQYKRGDLK